MMGRLTGRGAAKTAAARQRFDDDVERLRLRIVAAAQARGARVTCLVGQAPGVGTTTVAVSLARSLARQSRRTLLVDGNLARPALHDLFDVDREPGAVDLLDDPTALHRAVRLTSEPHLAVLPCGRGDLDGVGASVEQWHGLWADLAADRFVLIDAGSADSPGTTTIANASDGVILVVKSGAARREQIESIQKSMSLGGTHVLGLVLNQRRYRVPDAIYRRL